MSPATAVVPMHLLVDEHLPVSRLTKLVGPRGHVIEFVRIQEKDPAILADAHERGLVVVTADKWFYDTLARDTQSKIGRYARAGIIHVPGEWRTASDLLVAHIGFIEACHAE